MPADRSADAALAAAKTAAVAAAAAAGAAKAAAQAAAAAAEKAPAQQDYDELAREVVLGRLTPDVASGPEWEQALRENEELYRILRHVAGEEEANEAQVPLEDLADYDEGKLDPQKRARVEECLRTSVGAARDLYLLRELGCAFEGQDEPAGAASAADVAAAEAKKAAAAAQAATEAAGEAQAAAQAAAEASKARDEAGDHNSD